MRSISQAEIAQKKWLARNKTAYCGERYNYASNA
jgi:hypothetical protein